MLRTSIAGAVIASLMLAVPVVAPAAIYSPTQLELNDVEFIDFWPGNGATLDMKELVSLDGVDGVKYTFDTGFNTSNPNEGFSRTQFETPAGLFTQDLNGFDAFSIDFLTNSSANPLQAQVYLRYEGGGGFSSSGGVSINTATKTTVSIPLGVIPEASRSQITAFGIEIFSQNLFTPETGAMASAFTSPQPPEFTDTVIWSFEGTDGMGSLDGWGAAFQPDHISHTVTATGATEGNWALQIEREHTGGIFPTAGTAFRWGSQGVLDSNVGGGNPLGDFNGNGSVENADLTLLLNNWGNAVPPTPAGWVGLPITPPAVDNDELTALLNNWGTVGGGSDPVIQSRIEAIVDAINGGDQLAFDVTFENVDQFPLDQPGYLGYHVAITDGSGGFWQSDDFGFPGLPAVGDSYEGLTLTVPLSSFTDRSANAFGALSTGVLTAENGVFTMILATNTGVTGDDMDTSMYTIAIQIDNIRVRTIVPPGGGAAAVPEPSTWLLGWLASAVLAGLCRRRG